MIATFRTFNLRKIAAAVIALAVLGSAAFSWAAVQSTLVHTNNYSLLSVALNASTDGTTYNASSSLNWTIENTPNRKTVQALQLKNVGNGSANITFASTASGTLATGSTISRVFTVANQAACATNGTTDPTGTLISGSSSTMNELASISPIPLAPGSTQWICFVLTNQSTAYPAGAAATQVVTFTATSI